MTRRDRARRAARASSGAHARLDREPLGPAAVPGR